MTAAETGRVHLSAATQEACAGAVGGALGVLAGHPLDTLRIRMQQPGAALGLRAMWASTVAREGVTALFKGMSSPLASASALNALCFHTYAATLRLLAPTDAAEPPSASAPRQPLSYTPIFLSGCAAGCATTLLVTPVDLLKTQLQVRVGRGGGGPLALAASIVRREGVRGLYRGAGVTLVRDTPSTGLYYVAYEGGREALGGRGAGADGATLLAGAMAGVMSWASIYPIDVIKSRVQGSPGRYAGWVDCLRRSVADEGWRVLSRGLSACLLRAAVVNAAIFGGYEASLEIARSL